MEKMLALLAIAVLLFCTVTSIAATTPVLNSEGHKARPGAEYYMVSSIQGASGGGVTLQPGGSGRVCPLYVTQEQFDIHLGIPVKFHPINPNNKIIGISTDLNVEFDVTTLCGKSIVWKVSRDKSVPATWYINTTSTLGKPKPSTGTNWFKIEKARGPLNDYTMVFCPSVCDTCNLPCGDAGLLNGRYVGLSDIPF